MATVMLMHWPEVTREKYEEARKAVNWEGDVPAGAQFHTAWFGADGFRVLDLWDSREDFERFVQSRLMPGIQKIGIDGAPRIEYADTISVFAPNV